VATTLALCAAAVFIVGVGAWAPRLSFLHGDSGLEAWFLLSTLAWCLFVIQDSVLIALGRALWVPIENAVFSLLKLGLLAALAALVPVYGIFVSWTIAMLVSVAGVNLIIFARLIRPVSERAGEAVSSVRDRAFARYFAADYACSIAWLSTTNLMPVIVTAVAGATTNAYWALAYAVALPLYAFGQNIGTSLMLHGANRSRRPPRLGAQGGGAGRPCAGPLRGPRGGAGAVSAVPVRRELRREERDAAAAARLCSAAETSCSPSRSASRGSSGACVGR